LERVAEADAVSGWRRQAPRDRRIRQSPGAAQIRSIGQWVEGIGCTQHPPQRDGSEIGRILLERAGGDVTAMILAHVDRPADAASM
jgi:hypothetical protein